MIEEELIKISYNVEVIRSFMLVVVLMLVLIWIALILKK